MLLHLISQKKEQKHRTGILRILFGMIFDENNTNKKIIKSKTRARWMSSIRVHSLYGPGRCGAGKRVSLLYTAIALRTSRSDTAKYTVRCISRTIVAKNVENTIAPLITNNRKTCNDDEDDDCVQHVVNHSSE